ncbi:MAG: hypothetical protein HC836_47550 [Richelia sp. RM2_1_2]|nr:hypothetical protein [Richelia sp. RM2_1_2]
MKIELTRVIKTGVTPIFLKNLLAKTMARYEDHITWLKEHDYYFNITTEVETDNIVAHTSWPNYDHAVIYLELADRNAVHYKLVWAGEVNRFRVI